MSTRDEEELNKEEAETKKVKKEIDPMSRTKKIGPYSENYYVARMREFEQAKEVAFLN